VKRRTLVAGIAILVVVLVAALLPAAAFAAPKKTGSGSATGGGVGATGTGTGTSVIVPMLQKISEQTASSVTGQVAKLIGGPLATMGIKMLLGLAGINLDANNPMYQQLKAIKAQLDEMQQQIEQIQGSLNQLDLNFLESDVRQQYTTTQLVFTDVMTGYRQKYLPLVASNQKYYDAYRAAGGNEAAQSVKDAAQIVQGDRKAFYSYWNGTMLGAWRKLHVFLVGTGANNPSILTLKGRAIAKGNRYLTSADSEQLRTLYYGLQAEEALAFKMAAEALVPCANAADCATLAGTPAPSSDTALKNLIVDYRNAAVDEARQLPPMIAKGVVIDNVGGGSTDNKQEWAPQPAALGGIIETYNDLAALQNIVQTSIDPVGIDGQPVVTYALPTKDQFTALMKVDTTTAGTNKGFVENQPQTVGAWLSTLAPGADWQAIATRNSPRVTTNAVENWNVVCGWPGQGNIAPADGKARQSTSALQLTPNKVTFASTRGVDQYDSSSSSGGVTLFSMMGSNGPENQYSQQCARRVRQKAAAVPTKQIIATRNLGSMRQDFVDSKIGASWIAPNADLSYSNLAGLSLSRKIDDSGQPLRGDLGLQNADLTGSNLRGAVLTGTNLQRTKLAGANLAGVTSGDIDGIPASLPDGWILTDNGYLVGPGATLTNADLSGATLGNIDLTGADLTGANLTGVDLSGAKLKGVTSGGITGAPTLPAGWVLSNGFLVGPGANLAGANLSGRDLTNATLTGIRSGGTDCTGCTLPASWKWTGATSGYLVGPGADLTDADFANVDLQNAVLTGAILRGVHTGKTNCTGCALDAGWRFTGMPSGYLVGPGADLTSARLDNINLVGANLENTILNGASVNTDLTGARFAGADLASADLGFATLNNVTSGKVIAPNDANAPTLPANWRVIGGFLMGPGANLANANLNGVDMKNAKLAGADLRGATTNATTSGGVDCTGCLLSPGWIVTPMPSGFLVGPGVKLAGANLTGLNLSAATFDGITSGGIVGTPTLPRTYVVSKGYLAGPGVDLTAANLTGADLRNAVLSRVTSSGVIGKPQLPANFTITNGYLVGPLANLRGALLPGAALEKAVLSSADLRDANLYYADLAGAALAITDLRGANLFGARLTAGYGADAYNIVLPNATLKGAQLDKTDLRSTDITSIESGSVTGTPLLPDGWKLINGNLVGPGAILKNADLHGANLVGMDLRGVRFDNADLTDAVLTGVNLSSLPTMFEWDGYRWTVNASLTGAKLDGVTSGGIKGTPAAPAGWRLVNGYFAGRRAVLTKGELTGANLSGLDLTGANFTGAYLTSANLTNATLVNTVLTDATVTNSVFATDTDNKFAGMISGGLLGFPKTMSATRRFRVVEGYFVGPNVNLTGAVFTPRADLGISLSGTDFTNATLTGINFTGAFMNNAILRNANLANTTLTGANLSAATLAGVITGNVTGTTPLPPSYRWIAGYLIGPDVNLRNAQLANVNLANSILTRADLTGADIRGADLTGITWDNTICPNGVTQSTPCDALPGSTLGMNVTVNASRGTLVVDVDPDIGADNWTFRIERLNDSTSTTVDTYQTCGPHEIRRINLRAGTYRVVVLPARGYLGATSNPVPLLS
jgi:uncharacterized protein YjbI with pentapeptide repeats